mmetsp:Transcript_32316/g.59248  ORF Transcript_32316/g.59248 Transcript_32316/m.59248 type:complete len:143 (+) Transcript_32316:1391-1819(+)
MEREDRLASTPGVQLTMLTTKSKRHHVPLLHDPTTDDDADRSKGFGCETNEDEETSAIPETTFSSNAPPPAAAAAEEFSSNTTTNTTRFVGAPNTKLKWTDAELSKMRERWWDAVVRAKRKDSLPLTYKPSRSLLSSPPCFD